MMANGGAEQAEGETAEERAALEQGILGCLWGTAIGDALGLPMEGLRKRRQQRMYPDLTRYHLLPGRRGMVSDDTEHTWMVAQALLVSGGEPEAFGRSLARQLRGWLLCLPAGVGFATLRATLRLCVGIPYTRSGVFSAGNGPAMRSALLGVCWGHDLLRLRELVRVSTHITHTDPDAETGAFLIALAARIAATRFAAGSATVGALDAVFAGVPSLVPAIDMASAGVLKGTTEHRDSVVDAAAVNECCALLTAALPVDEEIFALRLERIRGSVLAGETTEAFAAGLGLEQGVSGYVLHTVPVALHAWLRSPRDYAQAVVTVIRCGGDTDTIAAIVGALVGTAAGKEGIRAEWRNGLWEWPRSAAWVGLLGKRLANSLASGKPSPPMRVNLLAVLARNLLFLLVVLAHGFRRLLPPY